MANVGLLVLMSWVVACLVGFAVLAVRLHRGYGSPRTPIGGPSTPRIVPPVGPEQPDVSPDPRPGSVRRRRTVPPSDPRSLGSTVSSGWRLR